MTHQAPLIPTRHAPDIWRRYRLPSSRAINEAAWEDARARGAPVGTCRAGPPGGPTCGGYIEPGEPYGDHRRMFPGRCATCRHETAAPGPAPAPARKARR
jgi:hypothetical protein